MALWLVSLNQAEHVLLYAHLEYYVHYILVSLKMVRRESVSKSCDVYSYGIVLWEIITLRVPFSDVKDYEIPLMVAENKVGKANYTMQGPGVQY